MIDAAQVSDDTSRPVTIDGKVILEEGRFTGLDEQAIYVEIRKASTALLARMGHKLQANAVPRSARHS